MSWHPLWTSRSNAGWLSVGLTSSFPDLEDDMYNLVEPRACSDTETRPGCKIFHVPKENATQKTEVEIVEDELESLDLKDQVVVFRYKGKFHAIDHQCPHSSYPLSKGMAFDIEDFGIVLSAGVTCPKHGWSFDLVTGQSDRGSYRLKIWEVQLRDVKDSLAGNGADAEDSKIQEVFIRRKQRIG